MQTNRYPASVFWSDEDEGFIAIAPDLEGCSAFGTTAEEALLELQTAISAWIEATEAAGNPVPKPSQPAAESEFSGKTLLRMPKWLHRRLATAAEKNDVSLNQYIVSLLSWNESASQAESAAARVVEPVGISVDLRGVIGATSWVTHSHEFPILSGVDYETIFLSGGTIGASAKAISTNYIGHIGLEKQSVPEALSHHVLLANNTRQ